MQRRRPESGFALLLVFAMAAAIAITMYMEMPNIVFEAQRQREELLIERGEQYKRAVQLYVRKFAGRYPPSIDALENTNEMRFLRHRYDDPMTGKKEWRLIHISGGVFTDSLVNKPKLQKDQQKEASVNTFITEGPAIGSTIQSQQSAGAGSVWMRARRKMVASGSPGDAGSEEQPPDGSTPPEVAAPPAAMTTPQQPATFGQMQPQTSPNSPQGAAAQSTPMGSTGMNAQSGFAGPGIATQGPNQAVNMIQQILTRPRPGGLAGTGGMGGTGTQFGNGIAGVASTLEESGIKNYNERSKYNEWEFVYDVSKDKTGTGGVAAGGLQPGGSPMGSSSGSSGGTGQSGSFGQSGGFSSPFSIGGSRGNPTSPGGTAGQSGSGAQSGSGGFGSGFGSGFGGGGFGGSGSTTTPTNPPPPAKGQQQQQPTQTQQPPNPNPQ